MNLEGEYPKPKYFRAERCFCALILMAFFIFYTYRVGLGFSMRAMASFILPTVLIWNADALAYKYIEDSGGWLDSSNGHLAVRVVSWLMIWVFMGLRLLPFIVG